MCTANASTIAVCLLLLSSHGIAADHDTGPIEVVVDCDAGDRLDDAFGAVTNPRRELELVQDRPAIVHLRGTCVGNFVIARDNVRLVGESTETTVLRGALDASGQPAGTVVQVIRADGVELRDLTIERGTIGLEATHSEVEAARVTIRYSQAGVVNESSQTTLLDSNVSDNTYALSSWAAGRLTLRRTDILRSTGSAVDVSDHAVIVIDDAEITGATNMHASSGSLLFLRDVRVDPGGPFGLISASSRSELIVDSFDAPHSWLFVVGRSSLGVLGPATFGQRNTITDDSFVQVYIFGDLRSDLMLSDFSTAKVEGSMHGLLQCMPTTNATCDGDVAQTTCVSCRAALVIDQPLDQPDESARLAHDLMMRLQRGGPHALYEGQPASVVRPQRGENPTAADRSASEFSRSMR